MSGGSGSWGGGKQASRRLHLAVLLWAPPARHPPANVTHPSNHPQLTSEQPLLEHEVAGLEARRHPRFVGHPEGRLVQDEARPQGVLKRRCQLARRRGSRHRRRGCSMCYVRCIDCACGVGASMTRVGPACGARKVRTNVLLPLLSCPLRSNLLFLHPMPLFVTSTLTAEHADAFGVRQQAGRGALAAVADRGAHVVQPAVHAQHAGAQVLHSQVELQKAALHGGARWRQPAGTAMVGCRRAKTFNEQTHGGKAASQPSPATWQRARTSALPPLSKRTRRRGQTRRGQRPAPRAGPCPTAHPPPATPGPRWVPRCRERHGEQGAEASGAGLRPLA